jgi:hypothetical protein
MLAMLLMLSACATPVEAPALVPWPESEAPRMGLPPAPVAPDQSYQEILGHLAQLRKQHAERYAAAPEQTRPAVLAEAATAVRLALLEDVFPQWYGTDWAFEGVTQTPREGRIACGYFVSTTLRDAGFRVERVRMAQQASEWIIKTLVPERDIRRYRNRELSELLADLRAAEDGLYLVGLDYHVGYLSSRAGEVRFCHSSFVSTSEHAAEVVCEDAASSPAIASGYRVTGRLFGARMMAAWLRGDALPTYVGR